MGHTYTDLLYHVVFSTKERVACLDADFRGRLFPYLGGIVREQNGAALAINGTENHVHLLVRLPAIRALADVVRVVKANSSLWVNKQRQLPRLAWQTGYGAFTVSQSQKGRVVQYIADQETHHRRRNFEQEFLSPVEATRNRVRSSVRLGLNANRPRHGLARDSL